MATRVKCKNCTTVFDASFTWSFPGIRKIICPQCKTQHQFGLSDTTKTIYWIFLAAVVAGIFTGVVGPKVFVLVGIVGFAFYKDWEAQNAVQTAVIVTP